MGSLDPLLIPRSGYGGGPRSSSTGGPRPTCAGGPRPRSAPDWGTLCALKHRGSWCAGRKRPAEPPCGAHRKLVSRRSPRHSATVLHGAQTPGGDGARTPTSPGDQAAQEDVRRDARPLGLCEGFALRGFLAPVARRLATERGWDYQRAPSLTNPSRFILYF